jgi:hypothetical protein
MNGIADTKLIDGIRALSSDDEAADRLFTAFSERKNDASETTVRRAAQIANADYGAMVKIFRKLEDLGAGRFIPGRHGYESRIAWTYSIRSLGQISTGRSSTPQAVPSDALVDDTPAEGTTLIKHEFVLRPGLRVRLELPTDLSEKEAERFAGFIRTLPIE